MPQYGFSGNLTMHGGITRGVQWRNPCRPLSHATPPPAPSLHGFASAAVRARLPALHFIGSCHSGSVALGSGEAAGR